MQYISKVFLTFSLICVGYVVCSQNNLVPNYSFELNNNQACGRSTATSSSVKDFWGKIPGWEVPELYWYCVFGENGSPDWLCSGHQNVDARTGDYWLFVGGYSEVLMTKLKEKLIKGRRYYYEFYYQSSASPIEIGIRLERDKPKQCNTDYTYDKKRFDHAHLTAHFSDKPESPSSNWKKASGYFTANEEDPWVILGAFNKSGTMHPVFYDDITIREANHGCPEEWLIDNTIFNNDEAFQASNQITIGMGANPAVPDGNVIVKDNSKLILRSNSVVQIVPGFSVEAGSKLEVTIAGCEEKPCETPNFTIDEKYYSCSGSSTKLDITSNNKGTWDVEWVPGTYLSNPEVINPTFTPPTGSGEIEYLVTVKTLCGQIFTERVKIGYDDQPNLNPFHQISFTESSTGFTANFRGQVASGVKQVEYDFLGTDYKRIFTDDELGSCCDVDITTDPIPTFDNCEDYDIVFRTKNWCTNHIYETSYKITPPRNEMSLNFANNIVTQNNDGYNESFAFTATGASKYRIEVFNRWGTKVSGKESAFSGPVYKENQAVWTPKRNISSGTYFYVLTLKSNCGLADKTYNGYFQVYNLLRSLTRIESFVVDTIETNENRNFTQASDGQNNFNSSDVTSIDEKMNHSLLIYPNPVFGKVFNIDFSENIEGVVKLTLFNSLGGIVFKKNFNTPVDKIPVNVGNYLGGFYTLQLQFGEVTIHKKIVVK